MKSRGLCALLCALCLVSAGLARSAGLTPAAAVGTAFSGKAAFATPESPGAWEGLPEKSAQTWRPPAADRIYLRYNVQDVSWSKEPSRFPAAWLEAARQAVLTGTDRTVCGFSRGFLYDFDWDGRLEAVLLLSAPKGGRDFLNGDSYFAYVDADGSAQILTGGCDTGPPSARKMDAAILHYPAFDHLLIRSGNETAAGGSSSTVYSIRDGAPYAEFSVPWLWTGNHAFLESAGPQGMGTTFWFWDTQHSRYSIVGPASMPVKAFLGAFDGKAFSDPEHLKYTPAFFRESLEKSGIDLAALTPDRIASVSVYGGRYYHILFSEKGCPDDAYRAMTLKRSDSGYFSVCYGPSGGMSSLSCGVKDPARTVYDASFQLGEEQARAVPEGLAQRPELQGLLAGNPVDYQRVSDGARTYELIITDAFVPSEFGEGIFAQADVFAWQRLEDGAPRLLQHIPVTGLVSPLSESGLAYAPDGGLFLSDVDFDGQPDLLVHLGMFGIQAYSGYACFLQRGGGFVEEGSFRSIMNPYVDPESKGVCAFWRNWAASHSWSRYEYRGGAFVETACITSGPASGSDPGADKIDMAYTCETLRNGALQVRETLLSAAYSEEALWEKLSAYGCGFGRISQSYSAQPDFSPLHY